MYMHMVKTLGGEVVCGTRLVHMFCRKWVKASNCNIIIHNTLHNECDQTCSPSNEGVCNGSI